MSKITIKFGFLTLLFLSTYLSYSQVQKIEKGNIIIHFKDGTTVSGNEFRYKSNVFNPDGFVYFKNNKKKKYKVDIIAYGIIKQSYIDNDSIKRQINRKFVYKKINEVYKELDVLEEGKVNLFTIEYFATNTITNTNTSFRHFYVQREFENRITLIAKDRMSSKRFIKKASKYFYDCPELILKIKNKEYSYKDVVNVIKFYNTQCKK